MASGGPADPQSWNRYAYVQNDPVNFVDPEGLYIHCGPYQRSGPTGRTCIPLEESVLFSSMTQRPQRVIREDNGSEETMRQLRIARVRLKSAIDDAYEALRKKGDCAGLFGLMLHSPLPTTVLTFLTGGEGTYGSITLGVIKQYPDSTTSATTTPNYKEVDIGDGARQQQVSGVSILVAWNAGVFVDGSDVDRAAVILHELGHAFNAIPGLGGSLIVSDNREIPDHLGISELNDALIKRWCF
jgi:hypothetical protein